MNFLHSWQHASYYTVQNQVLCAIVTHVFGSADLTAIYEKLTDYIVNTLLSFTANSI